MATRRSELAYAVDADRVASSREGLLASLRLHFAS
jgi:hypothetical protein